MPQGYVAGQVIVEFYASVPDEECRRIISDEGHLVRNYFRNLHAYLVSVPDGQEAACIASYRRRAQVVDAHLNRRWRLT